jgi:hypothetical protein
VIPAANQRLWLRIVAEGVVIVVSILLAFGIDAGWDARNDRITEKAYLARLLEDVRFDRAENRFVLRILDTGLADSELLIDRIQAGSLGDLDADELIRLFMRASDQNRPDYSRATYRELVSSGRIGLIRSDAVRTALANYDRTIGNVSGTWENPRRTAHPFYRLRIRSIPADALAKWWSACRNRSEQECSLELDHGVAQNLIRALNRGDAVADIRESMSFQSAVRQVVEENMEPAALALEAALTAALGPENRDAILEVRSQRSTWDLQGRVPSIQIDPSDSRRRAWDSLARTWSRCWPSWSAGRSGRSLPASFLWRVPTTCLPTRWSYVPRPYKRRLSRRSFISRVSASGTFRKLSLSRRGSEASMNSQPPPYGLRSKNGSK